MRLPWHMVDRAYYIFRPLILSLTMKAVDKDAESSAPEGSPAMTAISVFQLGNFNREFD
jgi:hypothetical protein